jgi:hypothetical protein
MFRWVTTIAFASTTSSVSCGRLRAVEPAPDPLLLARREVVKGGDERYFCIPPNIAWVGFGDTLGHVDVRALIPGAIHLSVFKYLEACTCSRYLSTMCSTSTGG